MYCMAQIRCRDDPSTRGPTKRHFDPYYTVRSLNEPFAVTICTCYILKTIWSVQVRGGRFITRDMTSTLFQMPSDISSIFLWSKMWMFCHIIFGHICDFQRLLSKLWIFCHIIFRHIYYVQPAVKKLGRFVAWFLVAFDVQPVVKRNGEVLSHNFRTHLCCPVGW